MSINDLPTLLQIVEAILQVPTKISWSVLFPCFLGSSIIYVLNYFPLIRDILNPMNTSIYSLLTWVWWFCFFAIFCKCFVAIGKFMECHKIKRGLKSLSTVTRGEVAVLLYVLDNLRGITWIPINDSAALSLYQKGYLTRISDLVEKRLNFRNKQVDCYAYFIPEFLRNAISKYRTKNKAWKDILKCTELDECQISLSE